MTLPDQANKAALIAEGQSHCDNVFCTHVDASSITVLCLQVHKQYIVRVE